jgi:hypothetical protein
MERDPKAGPLNPGAFSESTIVVTSSISKRIILIAITTVVAFDALASMVSRRSGISIGKLMRLDGARVCVIVLYH